jgi:4'-phosphopantetheinyl transferase
MVVLAFALHDIGVDVELIRPEVEIEELAPTCFSDAERAAIFRNPRERARSRFFEYWAAKESWIKADGRGMSLPLCAYTLVPAEADTFRVIPPDDSAALEWTVRTIHVRTGYACAVAAPPLVRTVRILPVAGGASVSESPLQ